MNAKTKTSGSEKRKRQASIGVRLTDHEFSIIADFADRAELTPASYARQVLLDSPPPRARRRPAVEKQQLAKLLGEIGKIGSNVNQIAHHLNAGVGASSRSVDDAMADVREMRDAVMKALGRKP